jgi:hypothetical protein
MARCMGLSAVSGATDDGAGELAALFNGKGIVTAAT